MTISLKDFILTGNFGPVYIGMPIDELKKYFGKPGDSYESQSGAGLLFYNGFEFYYYTDNRTVHGIQNDNLRYEGGPEMKHAHLYYINDTVLINTWFIEFGKPLSYKLVKETLRQEHIDFEEHEQAGYDELKFPSGVRFDFENWQDNKGKKIMNREEAVLNGIRYFTY